MPQDLKLSFAQALRKPDFLFGASTASYQIEGSTHADGRLPCIWDRFAATPGKVVGMEDGSVACDHYNRWRDDFGIVKDIGFDAYRMSIAWPRVQDEQGRPNQKGIDLYRRMLDHLGELGIKSFVTLYHWDMPQWMEDRGGWLNRETAYRFADYADLMARSLGNRVGVWTTFNEPWCSAFLGYGTGYHAPGRTGLRNAVQAGHHMLLAHGLGLAALEAAAPKTPRGIVLNLSAAYGEGEGAERAVELAELTPNNWFLKPLLKGAYPEDLFKLWPGTEPLVLDGDFDVISRRNDYIGVNYYAPMRARLSGPDKIEDAPKDGVERTQMGWEVYAPGLRDTLLRMTAAYDNLPPIYVTENGLASDDHLGPSGEVDDSQRLRYFQSHLDAVAEAMEAGADVRGYFAWSLLDNYEWAEGYQKRFGLVHVDYETQQRRLKNSALAFKTALHARTGAANSEQRQGTPAE